MLTKKQIWAFEEKLNEISLSIITAQHKIDKLYDDTSLTNEELKRAIDRRGNRIKEKQIEQRAILRSISILGYRAIAERSATTTDLDYWRLERI